MRNYNNEKLTFFQPEQRETYKVYRLNPYDENGVVELKNARFDDGKQTWMNYEEELKDGEDNIKIEAVIEDLPGQKERGYYIGDELVCKSNEIDFGAFNVGLELKKTAFIKKNNITAVYTPIAVSTAVNREVADVESHGSRNLQNINNVQIALVPLRFGDDNKKGGHFGFLVIDFDERKIHLYDSIHNEDEKSANLDAKQRVELFKNLITKNLNKVGNYFAQVKDFNFGGRVESYHQLGQNDCNVAVYLSMHKILEQGTYEGLDFSLENEEELDEFTRKSLFLRYKVCEMADNKAGIVNQNLIEQYFDNNPIDENKFKQVLISEEEIKDNNFFDETPPTTNIYPISFSKVNESAFSKFVNLVSVKLCGTIVFGNDTSLLVDEEGAENDKNFTVQIDQKLLKSISEQKKSAFNKYCENASKKINEFGFDDKNSNEEIKKFLEEGQAEPVKEFLVDVLIYSFLDHRKLRDDGTYSYENAVDNFPENCSAIGIFKDNNKNPLTIEDLPESIIESFKERLSFSKRISYEFQKFIRNLMDSEEQEQSVSKQIEKISGYLDVGLLEESKNVFENFAENQRSKEEKYNFI